MNTQVNIKTFVTLLIGVVVVLVLGGSSVHAQTTSGTATTDPAAPVDSSLTVTAKGTLTDPNGNLTVTGDVTISCRRVIDTTSTTAPKIVLLDFDFSQLQGTTGSAKTLKTYITGDNHAEEIRPLQASDTIIIPVPYFDSGKGPLTARTMLATATLNFDVTTGKLTGASISVGNNVVTSSTVGTFTTSTAP